MTSLLSDLHALTDQHSRKSPDELVSVPVGALRAAISMLARYETYPLLDRDSRPEWLARLAMDKLSGAKWENLALARREMAEARRHA
jgi:hypothetical protein